MTTISQHAVITASDLEQVYREMYQALLSYLLLKVRQATLAEDLVQETAYRAFKALQSRTNRLPTTRKECRPWLYRIATNLAIDTLRRGKCLTWCDLQAAATVAAEGQGADPQDLSLQVEEAKAVRAALACLPEHYRQALVLSYQDSLPLAQVAQILGITPGASKMLLKRAREAFVRYYDQQEVFA